MENSDESLTSFFYDFVQDSDSNLSAKLYYCNGQTYSVIYVSHLRKGERNVLDLLILGLSFGSLIKKRFQPLPDVVSYPLY